MKLTRKSTWSWFVKWFGLQILVIAVVMGVVSIAHATEVQTIDQLEEIQLDTPKIELMLPDLTVSSQSVFSVNIDTHEVVFAKNENEQRAIASITKLMTAYVVVKSHVNLADTVTITNEDVRLASRAHRASKLRVGMHFTRERLLNLALMYSENTAAAALGRSTFGTMEQFVAQMNQTALSLGMNTTSFEDPIGIGTGNMSTAADLVKLITVAANEEVICGFSTTKYQPVQLLTKSKRTTEYRNTNALVGFRDWNILIQKTGFTNAAGHCVLMIVDIQGIKYAIVVLDSPNNQQRAFDAIKVREWLEQGKMLSTDEAKLISPYKSFSPKQHKTHKKRLRHPRLTFPNLRLYHSP